MSIWSNGLPRVKPHPATGPPAAELVECLTMLAKTTAITYDYELIAA